MDRFQVIRTVFHNSMARQPIFIQFTKYICHFKAIFLKSIYIIFLPLSWKEDKIYILTLLQNPLLQSYNPFRVIQFRFSLQSQRTQSSLFVCSVELSNCSYLQSNAEVIFWHNPSLHKKRWFKSRQGFWPSCLQSMCCLFEIHFLCFCKFNYIIYLFFYIYPII